MLGPPRSGTTWVCHALASAPTTALVEEPDNYHRNPWAVFASRAAGSNPDPDLASDAYWHMWDCAFGLRSSTAPRLSNQAAKALNKLRPREAAYRIVTGVSRPADRLWLQAAKRLCSPDEGTSDRDAVVKSVDSAFSAEELAKRYQPTVVVVRRPLVEGAASWHRLSFRRDMYFEQTAQILELRNTFRLQPPPLGDEAAGSAWTYALLDLAHSELLAANSDWIGVDHHRLVENPVENFRELFAEVGLTFETEVENWIEADNSDGADDYTPRRLTTNERDKWKTVLSVAEQRSVIDVLKQFPRFEI